MTAGGFLRTARFGALGAILVLAALTGCASIRVDRAHRSGLFAAWRASAVRHDELSPRSLQTLRQRDLAELYARKPDEVAAKLHEEVLRDPQPELLFALAEIHYLRGRKAEKRDAAHATAYYYLCAGYAYHFLFDEPPRPAPDMETSLKTVADAPAPPPARADLRASIFDPRFRLACELYNAGLAKCIAAAQRVGQLDPRHELRVPTPDGEGFTLSVVHTGFTWKPEEFGQLLVAADYEAVGLVNQHRTYGLGVPLIATRAAAPSPPTPLPRSGGEGSKTTLPRSEGEGSKTTLPRSGGEGSKDTPLSPSGGRGVGGEGGEDPARTFYPRQASFAATAFFRFEGSLADLGTQRCGRLELYNPLAYQAVQVAGQVVPLETDLTTPLAYFLAHSNLGDITDIIGFVRGDSLRGQTGIRMLAPYQPGKIPVVLVHGLLSSPLTWAPVINDLQADPVLRERYQFWYYYYPTGAPYLASAAELRRELEQLRTEVDPRHQDAALDNMVFVGHSMGGLISKLMTVNSGDDFWNLVSAEPFDQLTLPGDARTELRQTFFFQRESCVTRCVFIGTPHHGSKLSPSPLGRLAVHLVRMPRDLMTASQDLIKDNPDLQKLFHERALQTSVDLLKPNSPALELLSARPRPRRVHYHTIAGIISTATTNLERWIAGDGCDPGDGVVPYKSAHLANVDSELIVPADHFHVHHHPRAVQEVRRILLEHYQEYVRQKDSERELQLTGADADKDAAPPKP